MSTNLKKAFIDQVLLGFFLVATTITFVATVSDELKARNKYTQLKQIVQTAALSSSKYYIKENSTTSQAENIALAIIDKTSLGKEVKNNITFTWDFNNSPNFVKTKIENYKQDMFWYKLLGMDSYTFDKVEAKANIIIADNKSATDFLPIAINGCNNNFQVGENYNFILKAHDEYKEDDNEGWYALSTPSGGQSSFAHFKNVIKKSITEDDTDFFRVDDKDKMYMDNNGDHDGDGENDDESDDEHITVATVDSNSIENDVKQISQSFDIKNYDKPMTYSIVALDCGSTSNNPIVKKVVKISLNKPSCAKKEYQHQYEYEHKHHDDKHSKNIETDTDHDGIPDIEDNDDDNDGIDDIVEGNSDTDHDGIPDYKDTDSDNDGIPDSEDKDSKKEHIPDWENEDIKWSDSCNNVNLFRINFDVLENEDKSILEY